MRESDSITRSQIESAFRFFKGSHKNILVSDSRLTDVQSRFFGYQEIKFSKDYEFEYIETVDKHYATETTITTETSVNVYGEVEETTTEEEEELYKPVSTIREDTSTSTVNKMVKFIKGDIKSVEQYENEIACDTNFKHFYNSFFKVDKPNFILYLLNFIIDFCITAIFLFSLLALYFFPLLEMFIEEIIGSPFTPPFTGEILRFNSFIPLIVLGVFIACHISNLIIKNKLDMDTRGFVWSLIAAILFVALGYLDYASDYYEPFKNFYENTEWFKNTFITVAVIIYIFNAVIFGWFSFLSIFKTRYFVALFRYLPYKKGKAMADAGIFNDMSEKYQFVLSAKTLPLEKIDFSTFFKDGIGVKY